MMQIAAKMNPAQYSQRRSHRTTVRRNFRCNQANDLSTFQRSPFSARGRPFARFRFFQTRLGMWGFIPRPRIFFPQLLGVVSFVPLENCWPFSGSSLLACFQRYRIEQRKYLLSFASLGSSVDNSEGHPIAVGHRMNCHAFSFEAMLHTLAAAFARGKRAVDTRPFPGNPSRQLGQPKDALENVLPGSVALPDFQPPIGCRSTSPIGPLRNICPTATGDEHV